MNILVNGFNSKTGGGEAILINFLNVLSSDTVNEDLYFIITPNSKKFSKYNQSNIIVLEFSFLYYKKVFYPVFFYFYIPYLIKQRKIDAILNLADLIIPTKTPQVYFFDWSYLTYPESTVWKNMKWQDYMKRKLKFYWIKWNLKYNTSTIVQTESNKKNLQRLHKVQNIVVIPTPLKGFAKDLKSDKYIYFDSENINLLCLANYAPHKNIEILIPLAEKFKNNNDKYRIITTLNTETDNRCRNILDSVEESNLSEYFINVGSVGQDEALKLLEKADALLLPTLLESYGMIYIEAMSVKTTIITSDLDFSREVCKDVAYYFDPFDIDSIYFTIKSVFKNNKIREEKIQIGADIVTNLNDWGSTYLKIKECLANSISG